MIRRGSFRPLLDDGIYWYKRKWGAGVHDVWRERELLLRPTELRAGIGSFFVHHRVLVRHNRQLIGKFLTDRDALARADVERMARYYVSSGMKCLKIFSTKPLTGDIARRGYEAVGPVQVIDLTACANPAATFCSA
jgi:hypothetical protein